MRKFFFVLSIPVTLLLIAGFHMSTPAARAYVNAQGQQISAPDSICHPEYRLSDGRTMLFQKNARDMEVWGRLLEREGVSDGAFSPRVLIAAADCDRKAAKKCSEGTCDKGSCKLGRGLN